MRLVACFDHFPYSSPKTEDRPNIRSHKLCRMMQDQSLVEMGCGEETDGFMWKVLVWLEEEVQLEETWLVEEL